MPGHVRDLRKRKSQPYTGSKPWQARWRNENDKFDTKEKSFRTKGAATRWLEERDDDARNGRLVSRGTPDLTLAEVIVEYVEFATENAWQEGTAHLNAICLAAWLNPWDDPKRRADPIGRRYKLARRNIITITSRDVEEWRDGIRARRSLKTTQKLFSLLNQAFKFARKQGYVAVNPCADLPAIATPPERHVEYVAPDGAAAASADTEGEGVANPLLVLAPDEIRTLAAAFEHPSYAVAVEFDAWMGLRASELWGLRRRDINLLQGTVTVRRALKEIAGVLKVGPLKTKAAYRTITMPPSIRALMEAYMDEWVGAHPDSPVFTKPSGGPVRHTNFYARVFKPTLREVLPVKADLTFKDLRHTAASLVIMTATNAGALIAVKQRLGHKKIETTVNIYTHLLPHQDEGIADALEQLYLQPAKVRELNALAPAIG